MKMRSLIVPALIALLSLSLLAPPTGLAADKDSGQDPDQEASLVLLRTARAQVRGGRIDEAKASLAKIQSEYSHTKTAKHARQFSKEVALLGRDAGELDVTKWFSGSANMNDGDFTVLVFWETWCPYCKREVPKLEALHQRFQHNGLNLIGLTRVNKSSTDQKVSAFIQKHGISYPVAKENASAMTKRFAVSGVPTAAGVKNGKIVFIGHPSMLQDAFVEEWLIKE
jgi:thiol-disulfide isomerase/thioredoxin